MLKTPSSEDYDEEYYTNICGGFEEFKKGTTLGKYNHCLKLLKPKRKQKVLDLGCGRGEIVKMLSERGIFCVGGDYSKIATKIASEQNKNILRFDARSLPFKSETFDVVIMLDVLEHLIKEEGIKSLKQIRTVLKKGGKIVIHTPNKLWRYTYYPIVVKPYYFIFGKQKKELAEELLRHVNEPTPNSLKKMVRKAGFENVKTHFYPKLHSKWRFMFGIFYYVTSGVYCTAKK